MAPESIVASPTPDEIDAVRRLSPLAADLVIRCGPFAVSSGVLASTAPPLEMEQSEAAAALREFLADDPWSNLGSLGGGSWLLLARDFDMIVVGQRQGVVGLGYVVTLVRAGERFRASSMGGWRLATPNDVEAVEPCWSGAVHGTSVTVEWQRGRGLDGVPDRVVSRVEVREGVDEVHFLVISVPNSDYQAVSGVFRVGVGEIATATFHLDQPLGRRALMDDSRVPAEAVPLRSRM